MSTFNSYAHGGRGSFLGPPGEGDVWITVTSAMSPYSLTEYETRVKVDCSGGNVTVRLPRPIENDALRIIVKRLAGGGANTITLDPDLGFGVNTIDSSPNYVMTADNEAVTVERDGGDWRITA